jgi:hypothetical protein
MKPVGKPDAGNPHVRFDERGGETEPPKATTAPFLDSTRGTLLADLATLTRNTVRFGDQLPMTVLSRPTPPQQRAFDHLGVAIAP